MKRLLTSLALVFLCPTVYSATYHVSATATGDGSGSNTSNYGAMAVALAATCGDTVNFYDDGGNFDTTEYLTRKNLTCTSGNRLVYQAASGETPLIFGGHVLSGSWPLVSGTSGVNAIYRTPVPAGVPLVTQQFIFERDSGKEPFDSQCANKSKPLAGGALGTGNECAYWHRDIGGTREDNVSGSIVHNGEFYNSGGFIYVRTSGADSPTNYVLTLTGSGACIDTSGSSYITVDGISTRYCDHGWLNNDSSYVIGQNLDIRYSGGYSAVEIDNSDNWQIKDSTIQGCGSIDHHLYECIGTVGNNSYGLIQNVDISYYGHIGIDVRNGSKLVIDDVYLHNGYGKAIQTLNYDDYVLQNSRIRDCVGAQQLENAHESAHPCTDGNGIRHILRFNEFWAGGSYGYFIGRNKGSVKTDFWIGHNTYHKIHSEVANLSLTSLTQRTGDPDIETVDFFNNLYVDNSEENGAGCQVINWAENATPTNTDSYLSGNGFWADSCTGYLNAQTVATFESNWPTETGTNTAFGSEPQFAGYAYNNPDFGLVSGNPAIDAGDFLTTTTNSGTGTTFTVADANMFYRYPDTAGGEVITVGDDTGLTVTGVSGTSITVDRPFTWTSGENISFDYDGSAPDIGANEGTAQGGGGSNPTVANDTLSSSDVGYSTRSVTWATLYANDTYSSATTPTIGSITGLTTSLCTVANDVGNTEVDITEVSGSGTCQFTYVLTDDVGSSTAGTVSFTVVNDSITVPSFRSSANSSHSTGGDITVTEPASCAENDGMVAVHVAKQGAIPALNTGWTSQGTVNANATAYRISTVLRGGSAPDLVFEGTGITQPHQVTVLCFQDVNTAGFVDVIQTMADDNTSNNNTDAPDATTTTNNTLVLRIGAGRNDDTVFASATEVADDSPESGVGIGVGTETQATAGAVGTENISTSTGNPAIHTATLALAGATSSAPVVFADAFTAANDTAINGRSPDTGGGTYEAETSCDIDSNTLSCSANDGWIVPTGIVDGTLTFDWYTGDSTSLLILIRSDSEVPTFSGGFTTENAHTVRFRAGTTDDITIQDISGGNVSSMLTYAQAFDADTTYSLSITVDDNAAACTGTTLTVEVNGADTQSATSTSCHNGTFTGGRANGTTWTLDNYSLTSDDTPDTTAPTAPTHDTTISGQLVTLTLTPGTDAGVGIEGYEIHKDDCAGGAFSLLTYVMDASGADITYEDTIGASETCKYKARMMDNAGNLSSFSAETSETSSSNAAPTCDASIAVDASTDNPTRYNVITDANCTDSDGDDMTVTAVSSVASNGSASVDNPASEEVVYTSDENYEGSDAFTVTVSDGNGGTDSIVVNVTVANAPSNTLFVSFRWNSQGSALTDAEGIYFDCSGLDGTHIADNRSANPPYDVADETTDSNGDIEVYFPNAINQGFSSGDTIFCSFQYPDSTATNGYRSIAAELSLQAVP